MLRETVYTNGPRTLRASIERCEVLRQSDEILTFPRLIELQGDDLILAYGRGQHGGGNERRPVVLSHDLGSTWTEQPPEFPFCDNVQTSGTLGYMRDGTIVYFDCQPLNVDGQAPPPPGEWTERNLRYFKRFATGPVEDPTFRVRRFSPAAELIEDTTFTFNNLPWKRAAYELYGTVLELDNGDLLSAFQASITEPNTPRVVASVFIARSADGGKTYEFLWHFNELNHLDNADGCMLGMGEPGANYGTAEPELEVLANGDILCLMRTGGGSPMIQSRSSDNGNTWTPPVSVGWPGVNPHMRLLDNGVLAVSSGRGLYGFPQITYVMFSLDGTGEKWEYPFAFHTGPGCSYTSNMERDGKLYVAYSHSSFTEAPEVYDLPYHAIKWVVIDID